MFINRKDLAEQEKFPNFAPTIVFLVFIPLTTNSRIQEDLLNNHIAWGIRIVS